MKMVYVAHPFSGRPENVQRVQEIIEDLLPKHKDTTFYSPLHATGFFYHMFPYEEGIEHCYEALRRCDELWLCDGWWDSRGCRLEHAFAIQNGIPVKFVVNGEVKNG